MRAAAVLALLALCAAACVSSAAAYPAVTITDSTAHYVSGSVSYAACRSDDYVVGAGQTWTETTTRGGCLLTKITATVFTPNGPVTAEPYTSSGTSYSQFAVIHGASPDTYKVTRVV